MNTWLFCLLVSSAVLCAVVSAEDSAADKIGKAAGDVGDAASKTADKVGSAFSGAWDSVAKAAGTSATWFKENVKSAKDLFGSDKKDLEKKVDDTLKLMEAAKDNAKMLPESFKKKLDGWIADLKVFKGKVASSTDANFADIQKEWEKKVKPMYDEGISKLVPSGAVAHVSSVTALLAALVCLRLFG